MYLADNPDNYNILLYKSGLLVVSKPVYCDPEREVRTARERKYIIKRSAVRSACIDAWEKRRTKFMFFFTVTMPRAVNETDCARAWELFLNNLRKNYKITSYVWVKERQKNSRLHYHIIVDRNRINAKKLQATWENSFKTITGFTHNFHNSVRLGRDPVVRSIKAVCNYLSKYFAKDCNGNLRTYSKRCFGNSNGIQFKRNITEAEFKKIWVNCRIKLVFEHSFFNVYQVVDFFDVAFHWKNLPDPPE